MIPVVILLRFALHSGVIKGEIMRIFVDAYAIHQSGKWYTNENIDQMLMERHLNKKARRASGKNHLRGPRKRTAEDDEHFRESFEKMIYMAMDKEN